MLSGVVIQLISTLVNGQYDNTLTNMIYIITTVLSGAFLTAALSAFTFEYSGIVEFVRKQAEEVLVDSEYIQKLSMEKLRELKRKINKQIYNPEVAEVESSLLNYTEKEIDPLVTEHFFESYSMEMTIRRNKRNKGFIKKHFRKDMIITPTSKGGSSTIYLKDVLRGYVFQTEINGEETVVIKKFTIDDKSRDVEIFFYDRCPNQQPYEYKYELIFKDSHIRNKDNITVDKKGCSISIEFETLVPITDRAMFLKLDVPSKTMNFRATYDPIEFDLTCVPFLFMQPNLIAEEIDNTIIRVQSKKWCLPGDGIVLYLTELE